MHLVADARSALDVRGPPPDLPELYRRYADFVTRALRRLGIPEAVLDDAVQDVFLVVHRRLGDFEARSTVRTWLFGIVLRVAHGHRRALRRRRVLLNELGTMVLAASRTGTDAEAAVVSAEASRSLHALLARLDDKKRAILVAVELQDMTVPQAAAALRWNRGTAYTRLRSAREALRRAADSQAKNTPNVPRGSVNDVDHSRAHCSSAQGTNLADRA